MKLGFVSAIFPDWNLDEVLRFAAEEKFDCVEVMCWPPGKATRKYGGVCHIDCSDLSQAQADDINALAAKYGVSISGLGYYPNILSADAEEGEVAKAHLRKVIDAAKLLGLKNVNTFIGANHEKDVEYNFAQFQKVWPELIRYTEQRDIYLAIENCPMLFSQHEWPGGKNLAHSPAIWRRMFAEIPSKHFGLNFDPSHFILLMMDYVQPMYEFKDKLFHTHAKDMRIDHHVLNQVGRLALNWATPKIPGLGDGNWNAWISALTDVGYQGAICVEVEDEAFCHTIEDRKRSLRISRNVLRPLIA